MDEAHKSNPPKWLLFEKQVGDLLEKFGYDVVHDTKLQSGQSDILARTARATMPALLVECKFHEGAKGKVGIEEAEKFTARVIKLRMEGEIDHGYLVTNTTFTASAKSSLSNASSKYVFFLTYEQLFARLVNARHYLSSLVKKLEVSNRIDLRTLNTTVADGTLFNCLDHRLLDSHLEQCDISGARYCVLPRHELEKFTSLGYVSQTPDQQGFEVSSKELLRNVPFINVRMLGRDGTTVSSLALSLNFPGKRTSRSRPPEKKSRVLVMDHASASLLKFVEDPTECFYVLLGDYGAGKSTILQKLALQLAKKKLENLNDPFVRIPLLLNLREYSKVPDFRRLIRSFLTEEAEMSGLSLSMFGELNAAGHFVLLLDGFDEMLERVTKPDRRRCFLEIAEFVRPTSKIVLTGRPGYFPDHKELSDILLAMTSNRTTNRKVRHYSLNCLQLMDEAELQSLLSFSSADIIQKVNRLLESNLHLRDLAQRPVLASMIIQSVSDLDTLDQTTTVRDLYQVYTDKWVRREEDKFLILIDPEKKATFVRYLAMEMHLKGQAIISFKELGENIRTYFGLDDIQSVDHFSHDIRTCSFLTRSDIGDYRFIHRSFMEFFTTLEFERLNRSPFAHRFNKPLVPEMVAFLDSTREPFRTTVSLLRTSELANKALQKHLTKDIEKEDFEKAAMAREAIKHLKGAVGSAFGSMTVPDQPEHLIRLLEEFRSQFARDFPKVSGQILAALKNASAKS